MAEKEAGECGAGIRKEAVILKTAEKEKKQTDTPPASPENSANPLISRGLHCIKIDVSICVVTPILIQFRSLDELYGV